MSAAVMSPTPALPSTRKASVWEKMFSGFKVHGKKDDVAEIESPSAIDNDMFVSFEMNSKKQSRTQSADISHSPIHGRSRQVSLATGVERAAPTAPTAHMRNPSNATRAGSVAGYSIKSSRTAASRAGSFSSNFSRRGSKNWWRSSNPEDEDAPPVPAIESKYTVFGSHNPDVNAVPVASPPVSRRPSYVPRNAAGSFLRTTTQQPKKTDMNEVNRQLSISGDSKPAQAITVETVQTKAVTARKDSHVGIEKHGMHSMAGICDIIEDVDEEKVDEKKVADSAVLPSSEVKTNPIVMVNPVRTDSAKGSPELLATKNDEQREPSLLEPTAV